MRTIISKTVLVLLLSTPAFATPITSVSWDGNPPGNLSQITGVSDFSIGLPAFAPGIYTLTIDGGVTAWWDQDRVGFRPTSGEYLLFPGLIQSAIFTTPDPWVLTATTPSFTGGLSTGPQWAFWAAENGVLHWGLEDIALPGGDADYQDVYGTLVRRQGGDIDPHGLPTVPEPGTMVLFGSGLIGLAAMVRRRTR